MDKLKIFNVKWTSRSAGPSLDNNKRTEVFLAGCQMAQEGYPCKGCFNQELWQDKYYVSECSPEEAFKNIKKFAPNKYITFVGGEPLDQIHPLTQLCQLLKNDGFHIIIITHYTISHVMMMDWGATLLRNIDVLIDGKYDETQRIWDEDKAGDGLHDVVGSGNQIIWDLRTMNRERAYIHEYGIPAGNLEGLYMNVNQDLVYITKDKKEEAVVA